MTNNPYSTPEASVLSSATPEDEETRRAHLNFEANIKAVGVLYYLNAFIFALGAIAFAVLLVLDPQFGAELGAAGFGVALVAVFAALAVASFFVGRGLRNFQNWARIVAIVFAVVGLLGFPLGTILNGLILYLLLSKKGVHVFTPDYQRVIAATPHIKYTTSVIVWIALGLLVALMLFALVAMVSGA